MTDQEEFQKKFFEYNLAKTQGDALIEELSLLNGTLNNLNVAKTTLENIKKGGKQEELLVPIGGNSFLIANLKDAENVLIGIGSNIVVKKPIGGAVDTIGNQLEELNKAKEGLEQKVVELNKKMTNLEPEVQKMANEMRAHKGEKQ